MTEISLVFIIVVLLGGYLWYMQVISRRNKALESLSSIDLHLQLRFDLIPNVLKVANKFMEHEKTLLEDITKLRAGVQKDYNRKNKSEVQQHLSAVEELSSKFGKLMVSVENYPELKSDAAIVQAMETYNEVEGRIAAARRFYNASVTDLNNSVQIFPGNLLAIIAGVSGMPYLKMPDSVKEPVDPDEYLKS